MPTLPSGTVTFLFTDIEGSTTRWEQHPDAMRAALARHDALLYEGIARHDGVVVTERGEGDSFFALFARPTDALAAACAVQRALIAESWPEVVAPIRVRMALHTGEAGVREGQDYRGAAVNRCARLRAVAHGGQILLSGATYELVRDHLPPGVTLRDLGEHRLKDLTRPEHIYQAMQPGLPADFPPLKTLDQHRHNLPVQLTPFIGRERAVAAVRERLLEPQTHLLTLTGPGGTGKTRLALQVAAEVLDAFPDGVFFVNLAPITDPGLALPTIAQTLGVVEQAGEPVVETLRRRLSGTRTLLVLDNFEQVVEAASAVVDLLERGADVADVLLLVTSRVVLQVPGEREYPVPPLSLPDPHHLPPLEGLSQYEAVRLFIERAQDVKPDFTVTNETAPAVAEICVRLDGLPLAIELAAARSRVLPPPAMLSRLDHRLALVAGGARARPTRQQTLRATIDWSYHLLTREEQTLFARLAVFVGGATLEAIESVCALDDTMDVLAGVESLVVKSLLRQVEGVGGEPRFVMLETIHEYAWERLTVTGEEQALREQHVSYYRALAERAAPAHGGVPDAVWLDRLECEHGNVRAALDWAHEQGEVELEARLAVALVVFWNARRYQREARERLERLLALQRGREQGQVLPPPLYAEALWWLAAMVWWQSEYERAVELGQECLALGRATNETEGLGGSLHLLGQIALEQGDYERARRLFEERLAVAEAVGDKNLIGLALRCLGDVAHAHGDAEEMKRLYTASLALGRAIGDYALLGNALHGLGEAARLQGDVPSAEALLAESQAMFEVGFPIDMPKVLNALGRLARSQGERAEAQRAFAESLALVHKVGYMPGVADALEGVAGALGIAQAKRAVWLFGAAHAVREAKHLPRWPVHQSLYEQDVAATREELGAEAFAAAWAEGQAMTLEQAIAEALAESGET